MIDPKEAARRLRGLMALGARTFKAKDVWPLVEALLAVPSPSPDVGEMEVRKDAAYLERNQVVAALASAYPSGIARTAIPGWSDDWHDCVYIDLPTGQASWHYHDSHAHLFAHLPPYAGKWDGHTTDEKYARLAALAGKAASSPTSGVTQAARSDARPPPSDIREALEWLHARADWDTDVGEIVRTILNMLALTSSPPWDGKLQRQETLKDALAAIGGADSVGEAEHRIIDLIEKEET